MEIIHIFLTTLLIWVSSTNGQSYHHHYNAVGAPIGHDGRVVDTPEVAQAKAAHLAAFSRLATRPIHTAAAVAPIQQHYQPGYVAAPTIVAANTAYSGPVGAYSNPGFFSSRIQHGPYGYRGPPAPLAHDGRVLDTPEVAQAKAAHLAAFNQAATRTLYNAPPVNVVYNNDNSASAEDDGEYRPGSYSSDDDDSGSGSAEGYDGGNSQQYRGPAAPLAEDGRVIDTPEVAHAKAAHLAAFQRASHGRYEQPHNQRVNGYYGDY